ncbi:MAG: hypothetical protein IJP34_01120 [Clostridia bacterium]|nr:hypothetical protein [Clostridia bacterium]
MQKKKEYLNQYKYQEIRINSFKRLKTTHKENIAEYNKKIAECKSLRREIEKKISKLNDPVLCELLMQKYVFGRTLEEIALILNYSKRHIERLHIKALEKFEP